MVRPSLLALASILGALPIASCNCATDPLSAEEPSFASPATIDFGPVAEGTTVEKSIVVDNDGDGSLDVRASVTPSDFALVDTHVVVAPHTHAALRVSFTPTRAGEDDDDVTLTTDDPRHANARVHLHGGPIAPVLDAPSVVDFHGVVDENVVLANRGLATLHIASITVDGSSNAAFSIVDAPALPLSIAPNESITIDVHYTQSDDANDGALFVQSDDPSDDGVARFVRLIADPFVVGGGEGEGEGACESDATWTITSGGPVAYSCCIFVDQNISGFVISQNGASAAPVPSTNHNYALSGASQCPATLSYSNVRDGGCTESYALDGTFSDANTFTGTYTMSFTGNDCDCFGGTLGSACSDQSFPITATRN